MHKIRYYSISNSSLFYGFTGLVSISVSSRKFILSFLNAWGKMSAITSLGQLTGEGKAARAYHTKISADLISYTYPEYLCGPQDVKIEKWRCEELSKRKFSQWMSGISEIFWILHRYLLSLTSTGHQTSFFRLKKKIRTYEWAKGNNKHFHWLPKIIIFIHLWRYVCYVMLWNKICSSI